jgi:hypothetical protein
LNLNLRTKADENRPFFTEGTNLFNIGNIFYSRRIEEHQAPCVAANEEVTNYPSSVNLINVKVSGRTEKGLGIGFLESTKGHLQQ